MNSKLMIVTLLCFTLAGKAETLSFKNFDQQLFLEKQGDQYINKATQQKVTLANKLIVKTSKRYNKKKLSKAHKQISNVKELYLSNDFKYFLAELKDNADMQLVMDKLLKSRAIKLVQPDILQATEKSHQGHENEKNPQSKPLKKPKNILKRKLNREKQLANALPRYLKFIGVQELWKKSKGKGVKIAVIDDGFDLKHKEFENLKTNFTYDATQRTLDIAPKDNIDTHGTKIAGVLFAKHDSQGIEGISPEAEFIAIRQPDTWTSNTLLSFYVAKLSKADIINCSWNSPQLMQPVADVVNDLANKGRRGKGMAVIFAAGNKGIEIMPNSTEASIDSAIVVGASNLMAMRPLKFSNQGKSVDLLSFGRPVQTTMPDNKYGSFGGTSLASTIVSGLSALILSQNPEFTIKQLQEELKKMTTNKKRMNQLNKRRNKQVKKQENK
jgi:subtilisin family serine protease